MWDSEELEFISLRTDFTALYKDKENCSIEEAIVYASKFKDVQELREELEQIRRDLDNRWPKRKQI
ncbi:hypothetical protein SCB17_003084 [Clostridium perfringens]|nr:hypothetical protein [Clostridium perfringens]